MHPEGTIYNRGDSGSHGEKVLLLPWFVRATYRFIRIAGAGILAFSILAFAFSFGPIVSQEVSYDLKTVGLNTDKAKIDAEENFGMQMAEANKILAVQKEAQSYGISSYFSIVIPKIDAASDIIANVDSSNEAEYKEALQKGVAHAKGTMFPSQGGTIFLFSHSTDSPVNVARYNAVFFLLRKLEKGDRIIIYFADKRYDYQVESKLITSPKDTSWLTDRGDGERLILQTCDPPGTNWNRLLVIATPVR